MADQNSYVEQVTRQAPFLEDYQRRLLASVQTLTDQPYAQYGGAQLAGFSADQLKSFDLARQGVGSYAPWLAESGVMARGAPATFQSIVPEVANLYRGATGQYGVQGTQTAGAFAPMATLGASTALGRQATVGAGAGGGTGQFTPMGMNQAALGRAPVTGVSRSATGAYTPLGRDVAAQGAFQTSGFDPSKGIAAYMSPYLQQVKDVAMADINREANLAAQQQAAQAVQAGAFGGGREGVQRAETARNVLETKAKALTGIQQAGYEQAQQAAMSEFARQQAAEQQAYEAQRQARLAETGRLSQAGLQSYEAQRQALLSELGRTTGQEQAAYEAQRQAMLGETGRLSQQQQAAYEAQRQAQLAEIARATGQSQQAYEAQRQALLGETGRLSGQQLSSQEAAEARRLQEFARQQAAAQQAYEAQRQAQMQSATGIAGLGAQGAQLLQQASSQMAGLGGLTQQYGAADVSMLSQSGALQQQQLQKALDVDYQKYLEGQMQPYQRMAFMSDILRGVPSTQSALTATSTPRPSGVAQGIGAFATIAGLGGAGTGGSGSGGGGFGWAS
jgi:hypothetical protein